MNHKIIVSGIVNVETNIFADHFPSEYSPVRYLNNQISTNVGGVAYNIATALATLSMDSDTPTSIELSTVIGNDPDSKLILDACKGKCFKINPHYLSSFSTPPSAILYASDGSRMIFSDLKDIQSASKDKNEKNR